MNDIRKSRGLQVLVALMFSCAATGSAHGQSEAECAARADRAARDATGVLGGAVSGRIAGAG